MYDERKESVMCKSCSRPYLITRRTFLSKTYVGCCSSCKKQKRSERSKKQVGSKNPNWKSGATSEADKFYNSKEWKELRKQAFERDHYTCVDCTRVGRELEANHIKPRSKFPELKLVLSNIETLCKKCHDKKKWLVYQ